MATGGDRLTFGSGGAFMQDTRREVEQYLARGHTRLKGSLLLFREGSRGDRAHCRLMGGARLRCGPVLRGRFFASRDSCWAHC